MSATVQSGYQGRILKGAMLTTAAPQAATAPTQSAPEPQIDENALRAEQIIRGATEEADRIVASARAEAERIVQNAHQESQQAAARRLQGLSRSFRNEIEEVQPRLVSIVVDAVGDIIGLVPDEELVDRLITTALGDIDRRAAVTIFTSAHDHPRVLNLVQRMHDDGDTQVEFVEVDAHIPDGTFRIEANGVSTEVGVGAQLHVLERVLSGADDDPALHGGHEQLI